MLGFIVYIKWKLASIKCKNNGNFGRNFS